MTAPAILPHNMKEAAGWNAGGRHYDKNGGAVRIWNWLPPKGQEFHYGRRIRSE